VAGLEGEPDFAAQGAGGVHETSFGGDRRSDPGNRLERFRDISTTGVIGGHDA